MAEFIFRLPSGQEVGRAGNIEAFRDTLDNVPEASVEFHQNARHFRQWLSDIGHGKLADELEKVEANEGLREKLLGITRRYIRLIKLYGSG